MATWLEIIIAAALVGGTFLMLVTGVGLIRLPDVFCRMHAAGKAGTLGLALLILAPVIFFPSVSSESITGPGAGGVVVRGLLAIVFQFLTTPSATHLLARACYLREYPRFEQTALNELEEFLPYQSDVGRGGEE
jgi:multicomponent Na+:H+ antiporter subunit G